MINAHKSKVLVDFDIMRHRDNQNHVYISNDNDDDIQWLEYMEGHERWWDAIWRAASERGEEEVFLFLIGS